VDDTVHSLGILEHLNVCYCDQGRDEVEALSCYDEKIADQVPDFPRNTGECHGEYQILPPLHVSLLHVGTVQNTVQKHPRLSPPSIPLRRQPHINLDISQNFLHILINGSPISGKLRPRDSRFELPSCRGLEEQT